MLKIFRAEMVEGFRDAWEMFWSFTRGPRHMVRVLVKKPLDRIKAQLDGLR